MLRLQPAPAQPDPRPYALMVCSSGGHLAQLVALRPWTRAYRTRWVTFPTADATCLLEGEELIAAAYPTTRNVPNLLRNLLHRAARAAGRTGPTSSSRPAPASRCRSSCWAG